MDFEEQLEKAEKSPYPSLVGASVKSADDSPHQNYIHPEKYTGVNKTKPGKRSLLNSSIGASLDDLISEGALLGSDEDFDRFLDEKGNVLSDAKFSKEKAEETPGEKTSASPAEAFKSSKESSLKNSTIKHVLNDDAAVLSPVDSVASETSKPLTDVDNYSTPNLSEYQIGHQISDHSQLLDSVKSYDLSKLPTSEDTESRSKTKDVYPAAASTTRPVRPTNVRSNSGIATNKLFDAGKNVQVAETDSLHAPYFQSDERSSSRSRSRVAFRDQSRDNSRSRSRSRSVMAPHLARGDSYKNTHEEAPSKYELPADMKVEEDEEEPEDRISRQSKPTLGDSIAAAEANKLAEPEPDSVTRDPSLVTSGDYTNFNADGHNHVFKGSNLYSLRSESSTNYLRSISRSRSRKPAHEVGSHSNLNEKNDSDTKELAREGALVSDDPYSQVDDLDNMMKTVLKGTAEKASPNSKNLVNDVSPEAKVAETKSHLQTEHAPIVVTDGNYPKKVDSSISTQTAEAKSETRVIPSTEVVNKAHFEDKSSSGKLGVPSEENEGQSEPVVNDVSVEAKSTGEREQSNAGDTSSTAESNPDKSGLKSATFDTTKTEEKGNSEEANDIPQKGAKPKDSRAEDAPIKPVSETQVIDSSHDRLNKAVAETSVEKKPKDPSANEPEVVPAAEDRTLSEKVIAGLASVKDSVKESVESTIDTPKANAVKENVKELLDGPKEKKEETTENPTKVSASSEAAAGTASAEKEPKLETKPSEDAEQFDVSADELRKHLESLPVYIYTSLAGGMQIITRTNRLATILQANGIKFEHRDLGTDEEAKKLWRRYAQGKTLPGVVRGDDFIGNWEFIEEVNEDYRLKEVLHETL